MNKKDFYKAQGALESGTQLSLMSQIELMAFADMLVGMIEQVTEDTDGDFFGTEGWEYAIGWE